MDLKHALNVYEHQNGTASNHVQSFVRFVSETSTTLTGGQDDVLSALMKLHSRIEGTEIGDLEIGDFGGSGHTTTLCDFIRSALQTQYIDWSSDIKPKIDLIIQMTEETLNAYDDTEIQHSTVIVEELKRICTLPILQNNEICIRVKIYIIDHYYVPELLAPIEQKRLRLKHGRENVVSSIMEPRMPHSGSEQQQIHVLREEKEELGDLEQQLKNLYAARRNYQLDLEFYTRGKRSFGTTSSSSSSSGGGADSGSEQKRMRK